MPRYELSDQCQEFREIIYKSHLSRLLEPAPEHDVRLLMASELNHRRSKELGRDVYYQFPSHQDGVELDRLRRLRALKVLSRETDRHRRRALKRLCTLLDYDPSGLPPETWASAAYVNEVARGISGEILRIREKSFPNMRALHLLPRWEVPTEDLTQDYILKRIRELSHYLDDAGLSNLVGFVILVIHGEYHELSRQFRPHAHGYVAGDYVNVLTDYLRGRRTFRPKGRGSSPIECKLFKQPNVQIPYAAKAGWTYKAYKADRSGHIVEGSKSFKMPEPFSSIYLSALAEINVGSMVIKRGCRIIDGMISIKRVG